MYSNFTSSQVVASFRITHIINLWGEQSHMHNSAGYVATAVSGISYHNIILTGLYKSTSNPSARHNNVLHLCWMYKFNPIMNDNI